MAAAEPSAAAAPATEVGVAVVARAARRHLPRCLPPLLDSPLCPRILVVDPSSGDGTVELAAALGAETLVLPREQFNHGLTRELARRQLATPVVVMLAPDAYPLDDSFLERLTAPVREGRAAAAFGRRIPHPGAGPLERLAVMLDCPAEDRLVTPDDAWRTRAPGGFCSNACAAWSSAALDAVGGFKPTLVGEERLAVAELLARGRSVAYVADAVVRHSQRRGIAAEFRSGFDLGWTRRAHAGLPRRAGLSRGPAYAVAILGLALREQPGATPEVLVSLAARLAGHELARLAPWLPPALARRCSAEADFWSSVPYRQGALALALGTA